MTGQLLRRLGAVTVGLLVIAVGTATPAQADATTGTISGHVTRPDGSPAANEWIFAEEVDYAQPGGSAVTDESGFYSIPDLGPGSYRLSVPRGSLTQFVHGKTSLSSADVFAVTAGTVTTVDERLLALGTLQVTVTKYDGTPASGRVSLHADDPDAEVTSAYLDASGQASLETFAGEYKVKVESFVTQWMYGKSSFDQADAIAVLPDTTRSVVERLAPTGSVTVTARDSIDGSPIANFCVDLRGSWCSGGSGSVSIADLPAGTYDLTVSTDDDRYFSTDTKVTVIAGEAVPVAVDLVRGASITTTVVDAMTGQPVAGACLAISAAGTGRLSEGPTWCTDAEGRVTARPLRAGAYNLFVAPESGSGYGAQWAGLDGGTGDSAGARTVTLDPGASATVPTVKLDRAGTISGVVTSAATGQPVAFGEVSLFAAEIPNAPFTSRIDESGRYSLDWLGPYDWPLVFTAADHARQWSGGVADRREAKRIKVRAGETTTYSPALKVGTVVTGTVTDPAGNPLEVYVEAFNAATGDRMGDGYSLGGTYRSLILGPQTIKIRWVRTTQTSVSTGWYDNDADFEHAKPVKVPSKGTLTLEMDIAAG